MKYVRAELVNKLIANLCEEYGVAYGKSKGGFGGKLSTITDCIPGIDIEPEPPRKSRRIRGA